MEKGPGYQKMSHLMTHCKQKKHLLAENLVPFRLKILSANRKDPKLKGSVSPSQSHNLGTTNDTKRKGRY